MSLPVFNKMTDLLSSLYHAHDDDLDQKLFDSSWVQLYNEQDVIVQDLLRRVWYHQIPAKMTCNREQLLQWLNCLNQMKVTLSSDFYGPLSTAIYFFIHQEADFIYQICRVFFYPGLLSFPQYSLVKLISAHFHLSWQDPETQQIQQLRQLYPHTPQVCDLEARLEQKCLVRARDLYWTNWQQHQYSPSLHRYAVMLETGTGGSVDLIRARELHWLNWQQCRSVESLNQYANMLLRGQGGEREAYRARQLLWIGWNEYKSVNCLNDYACCLNDHHGGPKMNSLSLQWQEYNWITHKHPISLHNYAYMVCTGKGITADPPRARELYWLSWKEYKNADSLHNYAESLIHDSPYDPTRGRQLLWQNWRDHGHGESLYLLAKLTQKYPHPEMKHKARQWHWLNWIKTHHYKSLREYARMLNRGIGGPADPAMAKVYLHLCKSKLHPR